MWRKQFIISYSILFIVLSGIYLAVIFTPEPPMEKLALARQMLAEARDSKSSHYATDQYNLSERAYHSAIKFMEIENQKFILFRDYSKTDSCCHVAINYAGKAKLASENNVRNLEVDLKERIAILMALEANYASLMSIIPITNEIRQQYLKGRISLLEADQDFDNERFLASRQNLEKADLLIHHSIAYLRSTLSEYFQSFPLWMNWYKTSIQQSKKEGAYLIVIDKMARVCEVYKNGQLKKRYTCELGRNWMGDKGQSGDKTTPEGEYRVIKKLENGNTKYYKALLIDYPNDDDRNRFNQKIRSGALSSNARIGGSIEIHGHGGKGADWTDGCIALKDEDMKELFKMIPLSTPVTIVGSLVPIENILK
jgi:hypothetical protein